MGNSKKDKIKNTKENENTEKQEQEKRRLEVQELSDILQKLKNEKSNLYDAYTRTYFKSMHKPSFKAIHKSKLLEEYYLDQCKTADTLSTTAQNNIDGYIKHGNITGFLTEMNTAAKNASELNSPKSSLRKLYQNVVDWLNLKAEKHLNIKNFISPPKSTEAGKILSEFKNKLSSIKTKNDENEEFDEVITFEQEDNNANQDNVIRIKK